MKLRRLEISALPGIEPGFDVESVGPGINVVHGPNAVGKSSLSRALGHLLYPHPTRDRGVRLRAEFDTGNQILVAENIAGETSWRVNGELVPAPVLPEEAYFSCYALSLETLLVAGESEAEFAATVSRELTGGYDLGEAATQADFLRPARHGRTEQRALNEASRSLRTVRDEHAGLEREQRRLAQLEQDLGAARKAKSEQTVLAAGLSYVERLKAHQELEANLEQFPPQLTAVRGDELQKLEKLEQQLDELNQGYAVETRRHGELRAQLEAQASLSHLDRQQLEEQGLLLERLRANEAARQSPTPLRGLASVESCCDSYLYLAYWLAQPLRNMP